MRHLGWFFPLAAWGTMGCAGSIGDTETADPALALTPPALPATALPAHGPATPIPPELASMCQTIEPGPTFVRRLTRFEYNNTVRDLLGDVTLPANDFPAEETKFGFDNNAEILQVSADLAQQYMLTAEKVAARAVAEMKRLLPCDPAQSGESECGKSFVRTFVSKAYRRKITQEEADLYVNLFEVGHGSDFATGIRLVMETALQSPPFLYRVEFGRSAAPGDTVSPLGPYEMASRLSYLLWSSAPDDLLLAQADADALQTSEQINAQVTRMVADPKAHDAMAHFDTEWLKLGAISSLQKDAKLFPDFSTDMASSLAESTRRFVDDTVWNGAGTLGALLMSPAVFVDAPLATFYGLPQTPGATGFTRVSVDGTQRAGLLTQPGLLAALAKPNQTSPIHRGKFVREQLLCNTLPPPPKNFTVPDLSPTLSTRERFSQHRTDPACNGCHQLMDPIGFGFEHFDAVGRYREQENGKPIDASGEIRQSDTDGAFDGAIELSKRLSESEQVRACVASSWFYFATGRGTTDGDACSTAMIEKSFRDHGYQLSSLLTAITQTDAFLYRRVVAPGGAQ